MRKSKLAAAAAVSAVLLAGPAVANHSWGGYHWARTSNPISLRINVSIDPLVWNTSVSDAIKDWDSGDPNKFWADKLELTQQVSGANRKKCSPIAGQILVCNEAYGQRGWLGIASITLDTSGHIKTGTTKLNDSYFNLAQYNTPAWRALVACQEIGHDFGLGHQDENFSNPNLNTCMDYTNNPASNQHPNDHDWEQLAAIYTHTDTYNSSAATVATNFGIREFGKPVPVAVDDRDPGDSPAEWGAAVHDDGKGRPDVFVMNLAGGGRRITHVFWALETKRSEIHHD
jgi:hypothetical protein